MSVSIEGDADAAKTENEKEEALREGRSVRDGGRDGEEDEDDEEEGKGRREGGASGAGEGKHGRRKKDKSEQETEKSGRSQVVLIFGESVFDTNGDNIYS